MGENSQVMEITFYCGVGETKWNGVPVTPGKHACISPVYGRTTATRKENRIVIPQECLVIQDSGAFSDGPDNRLDVKTAIARQIVHANKYNYTNQITHVASYDLLIDERWKNGQRFKERWDEKTSKKAVQETVNNAAWLSENRHIIPNNPNLVLSAQGVSPSQYLDCTKRILPYMQEGDIFGLGGWCITGKMKRRMMPVLSQTMRLIFPVLHTAGVQWVHVWGVLLAEALAQIGYWCEKYSIKFSTDSAGPSIRPAFGHWGYADWKDATYRRKPSQQRGEDRVKHVAAVKDWLTDFDIDKYANPEYLIYRL